MMLNWLSCFTDIGCFEPSEVGPYLGSISRSTSKGSSTVTAGDWQTVPVDVLQAVSCYLSPAEAAAARLTCHRWRRTLSCYIQHLALPTRYLNTKGARHALRRAGGIFPSLKQVTLYHAGGWCDPVQARMDIEPLVHLESRLVTLQPLSVGLPQVTHVTLHDATFTRDPWPLSHLAWLSGLRGLEMSWDTALWAPGQIMQEHEAMQGIFTLHQLSELILRKNAHLFLGEVCLSDATLAAAAAGLRNLVKLDLSTIRVQDDGFAALGSLCYLTNLTLRGQINVTLGVLGQVFEQVSKLEELNLGLLVPSNMDLRRIAAAYQFASGSRATSSYAAAGSSRRLQQQSTARILPASSSSGVGWRSAFPPRAAAGSSNGKGKQPAAHIPGNFSADADDNSIHGSCGSSRSSSSSSGCFQSCPGFIGSDWTTVFSPLRRLRKLHLQSDLVFLGNCDALRNLASLNHLELHGGAKFLTTWQYEHLPPSWISNLAAAAAAVVSDAQAGVTAAGSSSSSPVQPPPAAATTMQGAWPALKHLQIDNLQAVGDVTDAVAQLICLRTLILSGPCLLALEQQQQPAMAAATMQQRQQRRQRRHRRRRQRQQQQTVPEEATTTAASADPAAVHRQGEEQCQEQCQITTDNTIALPAAAGSSSNAVRIKQQQQSPGFQSQSASLRSLSGLSHSPQPLDFWGDTNNQHSKAIAAAVRSSSSGYSSSSGSSSSGSQLSLNAGLAIGPAAAAADGNNILAQDADLLTRLSPLRDLQCFHLHLPQKMPYGMSLTPFCLAHLAPSWSRLTSLDLDVPAATAVAAGSNQQSAAAAGGGGSSSTLAEVLQGLSGYTLLQDLTLRLSDDADGSGEGDNAHHGQLRSSSSSSGSSSNDSGHLGSRPCLWSHLPASLVSISLHNASLEGRHMVQMGAATPHLRHLRLLQCNSSDGDLWYLARAWPKLQTLIVSEAPCAGIGTSGVAAVAGLGELRVLGLTLEPLTDVSSLGHLRRLRYLLLDGRSNSEFKGVKALCRLNHLKHLMLPLLHIHHSEKPLLAALQASLPNTVISNIATNHGHYRGYQWYKNFTLKKRQWWREPEVPWNWYPTLCISP